jgi:hypothetical protein
MNGAISRFSLVMMFGEGSRISIGALGGNFTHYQAGSVVAIGSFHSVDSLALGSGSSMALLRRILARGQGTPGRGCGLESQHQSQMRNNPRRRHTGRRLRLDPPTMRARTLVHPSRTRASRGKRQNHSGDLRARPTTKRTRRNEQ